MKLIAAACAILLFAAADARAQTEVGIQALGLVSVQPVDESWVGMPYLNEGLGGIGPGFGAGINAVMPNRLTISAEFTMAWFSKLQEGRLVSGSREGVTAVNTLHDALLSGLIGYSQRDGNTEVRYLIGGATLLSDRSKAGAPVVVTGGIDVLQAFSRRASLVVTARYTYVPRNGDGTSLAAGPHVMRVGAGVRIRVK
jgi:hypothetical protein